LIDSLGFAVRNKFEQNVCKALKVRESQKFKTPTGEFSTGFSTDCVENFEIPGKVTPKSPLAMLVMEDKGG
jgi:hypothetical protein